MEKKFSIVGYREKGNAPILYDDQVYSLEEARAKALEYFHKAPEIISKIVIFDKEKGEEKGAKKLIHINKEGKIKEIDIEGEN